MPVAALIGHHSRHADFSRWVADVLGDPPLAAAIAKAEHAIRSGTASAARGPVQAPPREWLTVDFDAPGRESEGSVQAASGC